MAFSLNLLRLRLILVMRASCSREAASYNWSHVSPDIFGTIFQHSMDEDERHAFGAHYTSPTDIMKIVKPTIVDPCDHRHRTSRKPQGTRRNSCTASQSLRVLDPACGSGNFLYLAYREMQRLEVLILTRENELSKKQVAGQTALGGVAPHQFFGMDILPFAVELAKVTLSLAPKLASDELHTSERTLPLDNLDDNIRQKDGADRRTRKPHDMATRRCYNRQPSVPGCTSHDEGFWSEVRGAAC